MPMKLFGKRKISVMFGKMIALLKVLALGPEDYNRKLQNFDSHSFNKKQEPIIEHMLA